MTFTPNYKTQSEHIVNFKLMATGYGSHDELRSFVDLWSGGSILKGSEGLEVRAYQEVDGEAHYLTPPAAGVVGVDEDFDIWLFDSQEDLLRQWEPITEAEDDAAEEQGPEESDGETELEVETLLDSTQEARIEALGEARELLAGQVALFGTPTTPAVGDLIVLADYILRGTEDERRVHNTITLFGPSVRITPLDEAGNPKEES